MERVIMDDVNTRALKNLDPKLYEGKCIGLVDGEVVIKTKYITKAMKQVMNSKYNGKKLAVISMPKRDKILIFVL